MIKLRPLYEIKIIGNINPDIFFKLDDELTTTQNNWRLLNDIYQKYGYTFNSDWKGWILNLPKETLNLMYQDLLKIKNKN